MSKNVFITGTGTDVGKTYVSGLILKKMQDAGISCGYYKAAMSGNEYDTDGVLIPHDARFVKQMSGISQSENEMCPYVYEAAYSPHLASRLEGNPVEKSVVLKGLSEVCERYEYVTMEGSGGILCPIAWDTEKLMLWQLIKEMEMGCLIVADAGLGTINSVCLTVFFMKEKKIPVRGIIFNHFHYGDLMEEDNKRMCEYLTGVPVIACVQDGDTELAIDIEMLKMIYE